MTYLFIIIALPVVNSMIGTDDAVWKLLVADGIVIGLMVVLEREWGFHFEASSRVTYDQIALIVPERREELLADLRDRTGLPVKRVEIGRLDFLRDSARCASTMMSQGRRPAPARAGAWVRWHWMTTRRVGFTARHPYTILSLEFKDGRSMKRLAITMLIVAMLLSLSGCNSAGGTAAGDSASTTSTGAVATAVAATNGTTPTAAATNTAAATATTAAAEDTAEDTAAADTTTSDGVAADLSAYADATTITLGDTIVVNGDGAEVDGSTVTITAGGDYVLTGTLADGQVVVDSDDDGTVTLVLAGVDIYDSTSAPLYVAGAEDTVIVLAEGTTNRLSDGDSYVFEDDEDEPNATLFSKERPHHQRQWHVGHRGQL